MDYQTFYASVIDTREDDLAKGIHLYITVVEEEEAVKKARQRLLPCHYVIVSLLWQRSRS